MSRISWQVQTFSGSAPGEEIMGHSLRCAAAARKIGQDFIVKLVSPALDQRDSQGRLYSQRLAEGGCKVVLRRVFDEKEEQQRLAGKNEEEARNGAQTVFDNLRSSPSWPFAWAIESINEFDTRQGNNMIQNWLLDYYLSLLVEDWARTHSDGPRYVFAWCCGVGHPDEKRQPPVTGEPTWEFTHWPQFMQLFSRPNVLAAPHEYGARRWNSPIRGDAGEEKPSLGWWCYRFPNWVDQFRRETGIQIPVAIGECLIDGGVTPRFGPVGGGWRDFTTPRDCFDQFVEYEAGLPPYVKVILPFIYGTHIPAPGQQDFRSFCIHGEVAELITQSWEAEASAPPAGPPAPLSELIPGHPETRIADLRDKLPKRPGALPYALHNQLQDIVGLCLHWPDASGIDYTPQQIATYQVGPDAPEQYPEIAYHFVINQNGAKWWTLGTEKIAWHAGNDAANRKYLAVLLTSPQGGKPTLAQLESLKVLWGWLSMGHGKTLELELHKHFVNTDCPGPWGNWLIQQILPPEQGEVERLRVENATLRATLSQAKEEAGKLVKTLNREI